jgi:hypothetical protein
MMQNQLASEAAALVATVDPDALGVGAISSDWVDMALFDQVLAVVSAGVLGVAATLDGKLEQATDAAGTGTKDITGKAITQLVKASNDGDQALINCRAAELDTDGGFRFLRLTMTVGAAASDGSGHVFGFGPRYAPASNNDLASVVEIVA